jgi:hypothetical protein
MAVSPNKRRLYRAQEALQDAAEAWLALRDPVTLVAAVEGAIQNARIVVADYYKHANGPYVPAAHAEDSRSKASHVEQWIERLEALYRDTAPDAVSELAVRKLVEIAEQATIYDNWHYPPN